MSTSENYFKHEPWIFRRIGSWRDLYGKGPPRPKTLLSVVSHIVLTPIYTNSCRGALLSILVSNMVSAVKQQKKEQHAGRNNVSDCSIFAPFVSPSSLLFVVLDVASAFISTLNIIYIEYYNSLTSVLLRIFKLWKSEMRPYRSLAITA